MPANKLRSRKRLPDTAGCDPAHADTAIDQSTCELFDGVDVTVDRDGGVVPTLEFEDDSKRFRLARKKGAAGVC